MNYVLNIKCIGFECFEVSDTTKSILCWNGKILQSSDNVVEAKMAAFFPFLLSPPKTSLFSCF